MRTNLSFVILLMASWLPCGVIRGEILPTEQPLNLTGLAFQFSPTSAEMGPVYQDFSNEINVTFPLCGRNYTLFYHTVDVLGVLEVQDVAVKRPSPEQPCHHLNAKIYGRTVGLATITLNVVYQNPDENNPCQKELNVSTAYPVSVPRAPKIELAIFKYGTILFLIVLNFGFGCTLNLDIVKAILRRPIAPGVGFTCQYMLMPVVGFLVGKLFLSGAPLLAFGMLCSSCAPGGAGSNVWCLLLGGDVDLSLTMTFMSLTASMFMMPLWLFILGRFFVDTSIISIPYLDIIFSLVLFVVPCFIGIVIRRFNQNIATFLGKIIKPWSMIFMAYMLTFGLYVNRYIYPIVGRNPLILIPALLQPYLGFLMAFTIANKVAKQPRYRCITIAIETGVQNITIPMVMLQNSFPQPFGDVAAVMPVITAHFTPLPMIFAFAVLTIRKQILKRQKTGEEEEEGQDVDSKQPLDTTIELPEIKGNGSLLALPAGGTKPKFPIENKHELESFISNKVHEVIMKYLDKESDL